MALQHYSFLDTDLQTQDVFCDFARDSRKFEDSSVSIAIGQLSDHKKVIVLFSNTEGHNIIGYLFGNSYRVEIVYAYVYGTAIPAMGANRNRSNLESLKTLLEEQYPAIEKIVSIATQYSSTEAVFNHLIDIKATSRIDSWQTNRDLSAVIKDLSPNSITANAINAKLGTYALTDVERATIIEFILKASPKDVNGSVRADDRDIDLAYRLCKNVNWITGEVLTRYLENGVWEDAKIYNAVLELFERKYPALTISEKYDLLPSIICPNM